MAKKVQEPGLFSDSLISALKDRPKVKTVYLDAAGQWLFMPRPGYVAFEVSEILAYASLK